MYRLTATNLQNKNSFPRLLEAPCRKCHYAVYTHPAMHTAYGSTLPNSIPHIHVTMVTDMAGYT